MARESVTTRREGESPRPIYEQPARAYTTLIALAICAFAASLAIQQRDVTLYARYAHHLLSGPTWLRFPTEYPALASVVFVIPLALPVPYPVAFAVLMLLAFAALLRAARVLAVDEGWLGRTSIYLAIGTAAVLFCRYDLVPAGVVFVGVLEARRGRYGRAWVACVIGGLLKIFPFALLPGFFLAEWRERGAVPWRRAGASAVVLCAFAAVENAISPGSVLHPFRYELHRGFEFSSVPGTLTALIDPAHLGWVFRFGTLEIVGAGAPVIRVLVSAIGIVALAGIWTLVWRRRIDVVTASLAVLSVLVMTDRAFAPQYLIWLAPLWALWPLRRSWVAVAVLTVATFPIAFGVGIRGFGTVMPATIVGALRNVVFIVGTVVWFIERLKLREGMAV